MTAAERLAAALRAIVPGGDTADQVWMDGEAETVLAADPVLAQALADGLALAALREAREPGTAVAAVWAPGPNGWRWEVAIVQPTPPLPGSAFGLELAAAADACREALTP